MCAMTEMGARSHRKITGPGRWLVLPEWKGETRYAKIPLFASVGDYYMFRPQYVINVSLRDWGARA